MKSQSSSVPPSSAAGAVSAATSPVSADGLSARSEATFVSAFAARSSRAAETTGASAAVSFFVSAFVSAVAPPAFACRPRHCRNVQCHDEALFMFACELWRSRFFENGTKFTSQTIPIHCRSIFNNFQGKSIIVKMIKQVQFQAPFSEQRLPVQKITAFWRFRVITFATDAIPGTIHVKTLHVLSFYPIQQKNREARILQASRFILIS